jgi:VanZ family protein
MMDWIKRWGPAILFMSVIFLFSATPGKELPEFGGWDLLAKKGGHMLGYALLASAYYYAVTKSKSPARLHFILALCMAVLYAGSDEFHQRFVPGRNPSLVDVGIDAIGGLIGIAVFSLVRKIQSTQQAEANASSK